MVNKNEIRKREEEIFDSYKKKFPGCVTDGVVDPESYVASKIRILFVLKEVNGGEGWDLRDFLYCGGRSQTWNNIARWTEGILREEEDICWSELENGNNERRNCMLKKIASINLKKTAGKCVSDNKKIYDEAIRNRNVVKVQVELYEPNIIICGGTGDAFCTAIYGNDYSWTYTKHGIPYIRKDNMVIISYAHPEARVGNMIKYYGLIDAVKEIHKVSKG